MTIKLYTNTSDNNVVNKNLSLVAELTGTIRTETDIITPVLIIETTSANAIATNYIYIQEFNRYYYVQNVRILANNAFEFTLRVDVLKSFWNMYKECYAVIERQEKKFNTLLDDGTFRAYQNPDVITKKFPAGLTANELILIVSGSAGAMP